MVCEAIQVNFWASIFEKKKPSEKCMYSVYKRLVFTKSM